MANMRERIAELLAKQIGYTSLLATPSEKRKTFFERADAVLDALMEPALPMQNAGWAELQRQGIDIETVDIAPVFQAMICAAKDGK